jgi:hypothetical protein
MWRVYLVWSELQALQGKPWGRPLESFRERSTNYILEFDDSLQGVGFRLFLVGVTYCAGRLQNTMELAAVVCGLAKLIRLVKGNYGVSLRGGVGMDAQSRTGFHSSRAQGAAMVFVLV